jgi:hypothetical protein
MRIRFSDRLSVTFAVAADVRDAAVPGFVLQPLVENTAVMTQTAATMSQRRTGRAEGGGRWTADTRPMDKIRLLPGRGSANAHAAGGP